MLRLRPIAVAMALSTLAVACSGDKPVLVDPTAADALRRDLTETVTDIDDLGGGSRPLTSTAGSLVDEVPVAPIEANQTVEVTERLPHDPESFTQGLVFHNGRLFESRGLYEKSALTEIHPENGQVLRRVNLPQEFFGEGLAVVDDRLIQLTWVSGTAFVWDLASFQEIERLSYEGEGWGLCYNGTDLWMSDGTEVLTRRDANSFDVLGHIEVTLDGEPLARLNELECVGDLIWANVWQTDTIVIIDPTTGHVVSSVVAADLLTETEVAAGADVLNGIAYDERRGTMLITGKLWPAMFEIELVPVQLSN